MTQRCKMIESIPIPELVGERLSKTIPSKMKEKGLSQKELANRTGLTESAISRYVNGSRLPDVSSLIKLSRTLNCSTDYILGLAGK